MFFYILRTQEKFQEAMRAEHAQMRLMLRNMEARMAGENMPHVPAHTTPPESLSLGQTGHNAPADNGLELRFDTQERR